MPETVNQLLVIKKSKIMQVLDCGVKVFETVEIVVPYENIYWLP
jgi:hypothetical protein